MADIIVYDPVEPVVAGRVTAYVKSANTPDYDGEPNKLVNPDLSALSAVLQKYWKESSGSVVEMTAQEKTDIDDSLFSMSSPHSATTDPTINDDILKGVTVHFWWCNTAASRVFVCTPST